VFLPSVKTGLSKPNLLPTLTITAVASYLTFLQFVYFYLNTFLQDCTVSSFGRRSFLCISLLLSTVFNYVRSVGELIHLSKMDKTEEVPTCRLCILYASYPVNKHEMAVNPTHKNCFDHTLNDWSLTSQRAVPTTIIQPINPHLVLRFKLSSHET